MPLDPQAQKLIDALTALNLKPVEDSTPDEARESMRSRTAALGPVEDVAAVTDHRVPVKNGEITVRVYSPGGKGPHPALVFYHGGGWVIGDLYTHDGICRSLTNAAGCIVASVDYRLAPEMKYPVAAEDSYAAFAWVVANAGSLGIDARRVAVGGDSAGGNLAAVGVAHGARSRSARPGAANPRLSGHESRPRHAVVSRERDGIPAHPRRHALVLESLPRAEGQGKEPYASPLLAPSLAGLPPALVITAGCDPLRDEGEAYAARLRDAGVPVTLTRYEGMFHGFLRMTRLLDKAKAALDEIAGSLKKAFA